tara:strand:+ start:632 stop:889 length:258 start_codon:yes stop_codon:yes gene_type:complete
MNTNTNSTTNTNINEMNKNTIKKYDNFSSFYKNYDMNKTCTIYMILGIKLHNTIEDKPKFFRNFNRKIKHNKNRNIYPMKDTNRR